MQIHLTPSWPPGGRYRGFRKETKIMLNLNTHTHKKNGKSKRKSKMAADAIPWILQHFQKCFHDYISTLSTYQQNSFPAVNRDYQWLVLLHPYGWSSVNFLRLMKVYNIPYETHTSLVAHVREESLANWCGEARVKWLPTTLFCIPQYFDAYRDIWCSLFICSLERRLIFLRGCRFSSRDHIRGFSKRFLVSRIKMQTTFF